MGNPGTTPAQIGPYTVESEIGRGGMGVVYLATDSRLDRKVAIKALPEHFANDPERLARFEREARILASLTHSNIAAVYGLEEQKGARYLVMEYVEGESLQALIQRGPMAVDEAMRIAVQVASGVESAHDAGVIHRDLKPGNIVVTLQGNAKVLDFGLAKEIAGRGSSLDLTHSPTVTMKQAQSHHTAQGQIVGTAAYLSPEQARGKALDKRTDIWAFGCVLYEMLTGASPYAGETMTDSLGAILHKDPDWSLLPPNTPATIQLLLRRCLAKDPNRRLRDIGDARVEIEEAMRDPSGTSLNLASAALASQTSTQVSARIGWLAAAMFAAIAAAVGARSLMAPVPVAPIVQRYALTLPNGFTIRPTFVPVFDVADDGRFIVFQGYGGDSASMLYRRDADRMDAVEISGTAGAEGPTISPDGQWLMFVQDDTLKKISIRGGPALSVASNIIGGVAWGDDGFITMASGPESILQRVSENGGEIINIESTADSKTGARPIFPHALSNGGVIYTALRGSAGRSIMGIRDAASEPVLVVEDATMAKATKSGHLLFVRAGAIMIATFDEDELRLTSEPAPLFEGITANATTGVAHYSVTATGTLMHLPGVVLSTGASLVRYDMEGRPEPLAVQTAMFEYAVLSPDEMRIAARGTRVGAPTGTDSLWVLEIDRDILTRLATPEAPAGPLLWSPDGVWIYFSMDVEREGKDALYRVRADGSGVPERLASSGSGLFAESISSDGRRVYCTRTPDGEVGELRDVVFVDVEDPNHPVTEVFAGPRHQDTARLSPDGLWIAFEDGTGGGDVDQVYVARADGGGARVQVSRDEGSQPYWAPDGSRIYFSDMGDSDYFVVDVLSADPETGFRVSAPRELFLLPGVSSIHQVAPISGQFFGVTYGGNQSTRGSDRIDVALNVFEELNRLAPTGKHK